MKAIVADKAVLDAIKPLDLLSYLRYTGWQETSHLSNRSATWVQAVDGEEYEVLVPLHTEFADYAARMADALEALSAFERRSQLDVLGELFAVAADVIKVRSPLGNSEDGTLPLQEGVLLLENASNLLTFAASATVMPRQVYSSRHPQQVTSYMESLRLGQTERGSYTISIVSPVPPQLTPAAQGPRTDVPDPPPFPRAVTLTLARALMAMHSAAEQSAVTGDMTPWEAAVETGVSANLCEAVVNLAGQARRGHIEISFSWSLRRPPEPSTPRSVGFTSDTIGFIGEAARWFRRSSPVVDAEVQGQVIEMDNAPPSIVQKPVLLGFVDGKLRRITLDLPDIFLPGTTLAYKEHTPVTCIGTLVRDGRQYVLRDVQALKFDLSE